MQEIKLNNVKDFNDLKKYVEYLEFDEVMNE